MDVRSLLAQPLVHLCCPPARTARPPAPELQQTNLFIQKHVNLNLDSCRSDSDRHEFEVQIRFGNFLANLRSIRGNHPHSKLVGAIGLNRSKFFLGDIIAENPHGRENSSLEIQRVH